MESIVWLVFLLLAACVLGAIGFFIALATASRLKTAESRLREIELLQGALLRRFDAFAESRGTSPEPAPAQIAKVPPEPTVESVAAQPELVEQPVFTPQPAPAAAPVRMRDRGGFEEKLGSRWAVWVGGLALALGGLFLVRYSIEQGWIGPAARIGLGVALATALIAAGEWLRRRTPPADAARNYDAYIPGVLTAAGVITAFGVIYAAHALYGFIGPTVAFVLLGAAGVGAMLASALHGPALAGLGLAGSFATPLLVSSNAPNPWPVVAFLAAVAGAAMALAFLRRQLWLASTAVAGAFVWGLLFVSGQGVDDAMWMSAAMTHTAVQTLIAAFVTGVLVNAEAGDDARADWVAFRALGAMTFLAFWMFASDYTAPSGWVQFAAAMIAALGLTAARTAPAASAMALASAVLLCALVMWPLTIEPVGAAEGLSAELPRPETIQAAPLFAALAALGAAFIGGLSLWRLFAAKTLSSQAAAFYAGAAALTPLAALAVSYLKIERFEHSQTFAVLGALLALAFTLIAQRFDRAERAEAEPPFALKLGTGAFASAAVAAFSFALLCFLERGYLTVAFALAALGTAFVASRRDIPMLRGAVTALGFLVLARIAWDPLIMEGGVGRTPVLNWLLLGYGVPALAFALAARLLRRYGDDIAVRISDALSLVFAALLFFFQIRHALHGDPFASTGGHVDEGLFALTSLGFAYVLMRADAGRANAVYRAASVIFGVAAAVMVWLGLGLTRNPLWTAEAVTGGPVFSSLMLAYLAPAAMAGVLARAARKAKRPMWFVRGAVALALSLLFAYLTLETRHVYQGEFINVERETTAAEQWTYSAVWLVLALGCLLYGVFMRVAEVRLASAAFMVATVVKVFLFDMSGLEGVWRAFSFIALGLALIGVGLLYQRLLREPEQPAAAG